MLRTALLLCLLAVVAAADASLTLVFLDGKKKSVTATAFDEKGLVAKQGLTELRVAWDELTPASAYEARKALTPYDDGAAILDLSEFARHRALFPEALEQLEIALALGGLDEAAFEKRAAAIRKEEIAHLTADIDSLLKAEAPAQACLAAIKRLKERYPDDGANQKYEPLIAGLVEKLAQAAQSEQQAQDQAQQDKALAKLAADVAKENERKAKELETAEKLFAESDAAIELRQVSRVKRKLVEPYGAEKYYKRARANLRRIARLDPQGLIVAKKDLQKEYEAIEARLIECYLRVSRSLIQQRNYKGAVEYVRKVLLYDPINEEALQMVEEIRANRINFKLSDITNARPRVTGG